MKLIPFRFKLWLFKRLLKSQAMYEIAGAMRGPDYPTDTPFDAAPHIIKGLTTAVVRSLAGIENGVVVNGLQRAQENWRYTTSESRLQVKEWARKNDHFIRHIFFACTWLGPEGQELKDWLIAEVL